MIVRELITKLGFDADQGKVEKFDSSVNRLKVGLLAASAAMTALAGGLFVAIRGFADGADVIAKNARAAGIAGETYQELALAAGDAGVSIGEFDASVRIFSRNIGEARRGTGTAKDAFAELGIALSDVNGVAKSNEQLFDDVARRIAGVEDQALRASLAQAIFGRSGQRMTLLLEQGTDEIDRQRLAMRRMGRVISEEALANSEEFGDRLEDVTGILRGLKNEVLAEFLPLAIEIAVAIKDWALANGDLIRTRLRDVLDGVVIAARLLVGVISGAISVVDGIAQSMGGWDSVISLITTSLGILIALQLPVWLLASASAVKVLTLALVGNPVAVALTAIAAAVVLVVDEIRNWVAGNDTFIEQIFGPWQRFADRMIAIFDRVRDAIKSINDLIPELPDLSFGGAPESSGGGVINGAMDALTAPFRLGQAVRNMFSIQNDITVNLPPGAAMNPQDVAEEVRKAISRQTNDAIADAVDAP